MPRRPGFFRPHAKHRAARVLWLLMMATATLAVASPAQGAERAKLTWDTDKTDVDLHVWDSAGNHAWYRDQSDIPNAELSTDISYGRAV